MKYNHLFDFEYSLGVFNFRQNLNDFWSIGGIKSDFYLIKLCIQFLATSPVLEQRQSSTAVAEDLGPTATATVAKV